MALTPAEKQRRYREGLKQNPEKYQEAKKRDRERKKMTQRKISDLPKAAIKTSLKPGVKSSSKPIKAPIKRDQSEMRKYWREMQALSRWKRLNRETSQEREARLQQRREAYAQRCDLNNAESSIITKHNFSNSINAPSLQSTGNTNQNSTSNLNVTQIKKEKIESPVSTQTIPTTSTIPPTPQPVVSPTDMSLYYRSYTFYTCSDCVFEAHNKYDVEKHNKLKHNNKAKVIKGLECNSDMVKDLKSQEVKSDDSLADEEAVKRFSCGSCLRKMLTIQDVEMHVKKSHSAKNDDFFYYYTPNAAQSYLEKDINIYECAYCKSIRENLVSLKKHADVMHPEMEFRVKGFVPFSHTHNDHLACGYCYMKADSSAQLQEHSKSAHPLLAIKSIGRHQVGTSKNKSHGETDDIPNKRVKFSSAVFVCSHCGGAFSSEEAVEAHSKKAHSRFEINYTKKNQSVNSAEQTDFKFYKCEFCNFIAEKHFLDKHLTSKHKLRVTCSYCSKRFEFASRLKEHHDVFHKDLPLKYIQETVNLATPSSNSTNENKNEQSKTTNLPEPVQNKENSEPVAL